jgi:hypothetical protein
MPYNRIANYRSVAAAFDALAPRTRTISTPVAGAAGTAMAAETFAADGSVDPAAITPEFRALLSQALSSLEKQQHAEGVLASSQDPVASLMQSFLVENPPGGIVKGDPVVTGPMAMTEVKYDEHDVLGWIGSFFSWWRQIRKQDWKAPPATPEAIGNGDFMRIGVISDWGSGLYGAPVISQSIQKDPVRFDALLHLGDVYYSGTKGEAQQNFLDVWPKRPEALQRTLNGNHEMYTGGDGYFNIMLPAFAQTSSCCAITNKHWLLLGLDSAYVDSALTTDQGPWATQLVTQASAAGKKVVLFSHHQPFSMLDSQTPNLVSPLSSLLAGGMVHAWYWGHEHRCVVYDKHPTWNLFGRCIGHGGYPAFRDTDAITGWPDAPVGKPWRRFETKNLVPGGIMLDAPNPYIKGEEDKYGANGYVTLLFDGPNLTEEMRNPDGTVILTQKIA